MEIRFFTIKDTISRIVIKKFAFALEQLDIVARKAPTLFDDFCDANNLDKTSFFWEITK